MLRFFLGLGLGVILTVFSFGFGGVGHGTYAPMLFTAGPLSVLLVFGNLIPVIVLAPFLWALYFLRIPRIRRAWLRITLASIISLIHVIAGGWLAIEDSAFTRALSENLIGVLLFGLLATMTMGLLFYFAVRGDSVSKQKL